MRRAPYGMHFKMCRLAQGAPLKAVARRPSATAQMEQNEEIDI